MARKGVARARRGMRDSEADKIRLEAKMQEKRRATDTAMDKLFGIEAKWSRLSTTKQDQARVLGYRSDLERLQEFVKKGKSAKLEQRRKQDDLTDFDKLEDLSKERVEGSQNQQDPDLAKKLSPAQSVVVDKIVELALKHCLVADKKTFTTCLTLFVLHNEAERVAQQNAGKYDKWDQEKDEADASGQAVNLALGKELSAAAVSASKAAAAAFDAVKQNETCLAWDRKMLPMHEPIQDVSSLPDTVTNDDGNENGDGSQSSDWRTTAAGNGRSKIWFDLCNDEKLSSDGAGTMVYVRCASVSHLAAAELLSQNLHVPQVHGEERRTRP